MKLSRTPLLPLLTIVAGGVIGASLSFGFLGLRSDDVPVRALLYESSATLESATRAADQALQLDALIERAPGLNFTRLDGSIGVGASINIRGFSSVELGDQPLVYVDGVRIR